MIFKFRGSDYYLGSRTFVMGILNITPDSFSDGGKYFKDKLDLDKVIADAVIMEKSGADFIDIGGESTRPGSKKITIDEELERVIPVITQLSKKLKVPLSIDTYKSAVAEEALKAGAEIVNDISGFRFDERISEVTGKYNASCVLMHIKGTPADMQTDPVYENVVEEVYEYLKDSVRIARESGIKQIIVDAGIGFGKTFNHNIELIQNLKKFKELDCPVLLGVSRKSFINKIYPSSSEERLVGTIAANVAGIMTGADIIRVHDVIENVRAAKVADAILYNSK
ncbi:MAG: dihydropteroate synthase [bacterium]|nr:dihydropteroate synthase [bacterium]